MPRPLQQHRVGDLEALFTTSATDYKVLKQLKQELQHRQVPRAVALLAQVEAALTDKTLVKTGGTQPPSAVTPEMRLPDPPVAVEAEVSPLPPLLSSARVRVSGPDVQVEQGELLPPRPPVRLKEATPAARETVLPLAEAYKVLQVTAGTSWQDVENSRRQLVQASHPAQLKTLFEERRQQVLADAKKVNAAYRALSQARCNGSSAPTTSKTT